MINSKIKIKLISSDDQEELFNIINSNREHLKRYLKWVEFTNEINDLNDFIKKSKDLYENKKGANYKIVYNNNFIGIISLIITNELNKVIEIGYWIIEGYTNLGIVTNCVKIIESMIVQNYDVKKIELKCAIENIPSNRVAIKNNYIFCNIIKDYQTINGNKLDYNIYEKNV